MRARVRARLPRLLRSKVGESDVIQEVHLAMLQRIGEFEDRGEGSFAHWLGKVLEHKIRDEVRRYLGTSKRAAWRETHAASSGSGPPIPSPDLTPGAAAAQAEERARLHDAMARLDGPDQEVLCLVHQEGLRFTEAADRLGITPDAARMRYNRALKRLAQHLPKPEASHG